MSRGLTLIVIGAVCVAGCARSALAPTPIEPLLGAGGSTVAARIAVTNFVAFGDSITWGEDGRNDASEPLNLVRTRVRVTDPYPKLLAFYLQTRYASQPIAVANEGQRGEPAGGGGDSGPSGPTRARFDTAVVEGAYQAVLLMEGANDIGDGEDGIPAGVNGLRNMIDDAKSHGIRVFLATIPPEQQNANPIPFSRNVPEDAVLSMNSQIRSLAASERVALVDIYSAFPSPDTNDLYALGLLSRDGLHPLEGGYELIAHTFLDEIVRELELPPATATPTSTKVSAHGAGTTVR